MQKLLTDLLDIVGIQPNTSKRLTGELFIKNIINTKLGLILSTLIILPRGVINTRSSINNIIASPIFIALLENSPCLNTGSFKFLQDIE